MNTTTKFRSLLLVSLSLLLGNAYGRSEIPASEKRKEVNQTFAVGASDQLRVDNRYGNITVVHWDKNEVAIRVVIEAKANSDSRAQELIDRVTISLNKSGNTVSAVTSLKSGQFQSESNENWSINYYITMPPALTSSLSQRYGNINLPDRNEGQCRIELQYGNLKAGSFTAPLTIEARYSNVEMEDLATVRMNLSYAGKAIIGNAATADIDSKYSNLETKDVRTLNLTASYGNLKAGRIGRAQLDLRYSNGDISTVEETLTVNQLNYGTLDVKELPATFANVTASARYGNLHLAIPAGAAFSVTAENMRYGNFSIEHSAQTRKEGNTVYSTIGNGGGKISFNGGSYGNLKIRTL